MASTGELHRRGVEYVVDIPEPVLSGQPEPSESDGFVTRRLVDVALSREVIRAVSRSVNSSALAYDTYTGSMQVRYALTRLTAISA